jgi:hypothetical protein
MGCTSTVAIVAAVTLVVQSVDYDKRKKLNTNLPKTANQAKTSGWDDSVKANLHQYTAKKKPNEKYVSPDGKREAIYNSSGDPVTDSRDIGTYNFIPSGDLFENIGHGLADVLPWVIFGNDDDDPGLLINEIIKLFE